MGQITTCLTSVTAIKEKLCFGVTAFKVFKKTRCLLNNYISEERKINIGRKTSFENSTFRIWKTGYSKMPSNTITKTIINFYIPLQFRLM